MSSVDYLGCVEHDFGRVAGNSETIPPTGDPNEAS
jgi:hypothetical protein